MVESNLQVLQTKELFHQTYKLEKVLVEEIITLLRH
jgi:hypothetical protein